MPGNSSTTELHRPSALGKDFTREQEDGNEEHALGLKDSAQPEKEKFTRWLSSRCKCQREPRKGSAEFVKHGGAEKRIPNNKHGVGAKSVAKVIHQYIREMDEHRKVI